jgi:hypothetical protein
MNHCQPTLTQSVWRLTPHLSCCPRSKVQAARACCRTSQCGTKTTSMWSQVTAWTTRPTRKSPGVSSNFTTRQSIFGAISSARCYSLLWQCYFMSFIPTCRLWVKKEWLNTIIYLKTWRLKNLHTIRSLSCRKMSSWPVWQFRRARMTRRAM